MLEDSLMRILVDGLVLVNWLYCLCLRRMDEFFEVGNLLYLLYWRFALIVIPAVKTFGPRFE